MASKDSTMKSHAKRRFDERYGINLSELVHQQIVQRIQSGFNARFLMSQSNRISVWAVNLMNMAIPGDCPSTIPVVYDKERKMLVTALPVACLDINQIGIYLD